MHNAFLLQSIGETRMAYQTFKHAYQGALDEGEPISKLRLANDLFVWYRKYAWSCGLATKPSNCVDEHHSDRMTSGFRSPTFIDESDDSPLQDPRYESEWGKTPEQARNIRQFMLGVVQVLSGVFVASTTGAKNSGWTLIGTGVTTMISALNTDWTEHQKRIQELKQIECQAYNACQ